MSDYDWSLGGGAPIIPLEEFASQWKKISLWQENYTLGWPNIAPQKLIMTSGGFAPIHPGHLTSFIDAKLIVEEEAKHNTNAPIPGLVVVVNGDSFLQRKHGRAFQDLKTRCQIVSFAKGVDFVVPFESDSNTVEDALKIIKPDIFAKGGDRDISNIPEKDTCDELNIEILTGVGKNKVWSSSNFLKEWERPLRDYIETLQSGSNI